MKYYKIILNNQIIGAATSNDCFYFQSRHLMLVRSDIDKAEYFEYNGKLYHGEWMQPIQTDLYQYQVAVILEITQEEYNILTPAIENAPVEIEPEVDETPITPPVDPIDELTVEYVRSSKINEMSRACNQIIEAGFDIELNGETHHFSLTTQDQLNLISLQGMLGQGMLQVPYHADGEICRFYSVAEMDAIITAATGFKIYHTTYYNALKNYINSLDNIQDIAAITYGIELPEEYQSDVLKTLL